MTAAAVENLQIKVFIFLFCLLARKGLQNQEVEIYLSYIDQPDIMSVLLTRLFQVFQVRDEARLRALAQPHAGDWLNVLPNSNLGLHMPSIEFRTMMKYRLGIKVFRKNTDCPIGSRRRSCHCLWL
jgi:hypothetical protein